MWSSHTGCLMELESIEGTVYRVKWLQDTLSSSIRYPTEEKVNAFIADYFLPNNQRHLFIAKYADTNVGLIGIEIINEEYAIIKHIAVDVELRWKGIGKFMIRSVLQQFNLKRISAIANDEIVGFFEACDFMLKRKEKSGYTGIEYFDCTKIV